MIGSTIEKNVRSGVHPSIIAASSISTGIDLTKPVNMNTASPAPKPKYTMMMPHGVLRPSLSEVRARVNMTIWNGTTIEKTHSR